MDAASEVEADEYVNSTLKCIEELVDSSRYLAAHTMYLDLIKDLQVSSVVRNEQLIEKLDRNVRVQLMLNRVGDIQQSLSNTHSTEDWILGLDMFGICTYYRKCEQDENTIIVKMEGVMDDLPVFEQMAVIHEIDLYHTWAPFCTKSVMVDKIGKAELYGYLRVGLPVFSRDFLMHAYGADCLMEEGKIVLLGKSTEEYKEKDVPWKTVGWCHNRLYVKEFEAVIEIISPTCAKTKIVSRVDMNAPLPHTLINFLIRNLAGIMLYVLQQQVIKVANHYDCEHAQRIRADTEFYRDWLLPKFRHYCAHRNWQQPTIASLGADGLPAQKRTIAVEEEEEEEEEEVLLVLLALLAIAIAGTVVVVGLAGARAAVRSAESRTPVVDSATRQTEYPGESPPSLPL